jgi:hypothetical protein
VEENMTNANNPKLAGKFLEQHEYMELSDAPAILKEFDEVGVKIKTFIPALENEFGVAGSKLLAILTPKNATRILKVVSACGGNDVLKVNVTGGDE